MDIWEFPDGKDVTIVCAELPARLRLPYADPTNPDFVRLYRFADLDALFEIFGYIRATNPYNHVHICTSVELDDDDYSNHLVALGGVDWNSLTREILGLVDLPVGQFSRADDRDPGGFEVSHKGSRQVFRPVVDGHGGLVEDVAHFYRAPNPFDERRTVTICNGNFARGTLAAVRALTDGRFRDRNDAYLAARFPSGEQFSILFRVFVVNGVVVTPDWTTSILHEWPPRED